MDWGDWRTGPSITRVVLDIHHRLAAVRDTGFAVEDIVRDDCPPNLLSQLDLRFVGLELTAADQNGAAGHLQRVTSFIVAIPLHEGAIAEAHRTLARDFRNLVAGPPKGAVHKAHAAGVGGLHAHHRGIGAVEGDELAVGDQQRKRSAVLHDHGGVTIIRADAQEIPVAEASRGLDELVADVIAKAKGVEDVLPVAAAEDKRLPVRLLLVEQARFHAPPRVEMHVLDPPDVVDHVHIDAPSQGLAVHVPDQVPLIATGIDAVVGVK